MKFSDIMWLSAMTVLVIIGIHQTMLNGIGAAYWIIMLAVVLLLVYNFRRNRNSAQKMAEKPKKRSKSKKDR